MQFGLKGIQLEETIDWQNINSSTHRQQDESNKSDFKRRTEIIQQH